MIRHTIARADGSRIEVAVTERSIGSFDDATPPDELRRRRVVVEDELLGSRDRTVSDWISLRQVHGTRVIDSREFIGSETLEHADGMLLFQNGPIGSVKAADCAQVLIAGEQGPVALAHVGWRGLADGMVSAMATELFAQGVKPERAVVGPHIGVACYEFSTKDLSQLQEHFGDGVVGRTSDGTPAFDMRAGMTTALHDLGVEDIFFLGSCTACGDRWFSHRSRAESGRHIMAAQVISGDSVVDPSNEGVSENHV